MLYISLFLSPRSLLTAFSKYDPSLPLDEKSIVRYYCLFFFPFLCLFLGNRSTLTTLRQCSGTCSHKNVQFKISKFQTWKFSAGLVVGTGTFTAMAQVQSVVVGELRSHKSHDATKKKKNPKHLQT